MTRNLINYHTAFKIVTQGDIITVWKNGVMVILNFAAADPEGEILCGIGHGVAIATEKE